MSKRKTFQFIIPYIILACALLTGVLIVRPMQDLIHQELKNLQTSLVVAVERATGLTVHYSHLSPSLLLRADINDVRLERPDGSILFSADQIRISYNILDFLSGSPLSAVRRIEMLGGHLFFDQAKDSDRFGLNSAGTAATPVDGLPVQIQGTIEQLGRTIPVGIELSFIDTQIELQASTFTLHLQSPVASLESRVDRLDFHVGLGLSSALVLLGKKGGNFEGGLDFEGQYFRQSRQLQTQVSTRQLQTPWGALAPQKLALSFSPH